MNRWKVIAGLTVIFVSGMVVGTIGSVVYTRHQIRTRINAIISGDVRATAQIIVDRLDKALNLTDDQESKIRPTIEKAVRQVAALRARLRPQFQRIFSETSDELKRCLDTEQKKQLESVLTRIRRGLSVPEPRKEDRP